MSAAKGMEICLKRSFFVRIFNEAANVTYSVRDAFRIYAIQIISAPGKKN
jgi:hypothetical protein